MSLKHVISAKQFSKRWLEEDFLPLAEKMEIIVARRGCLELTGKRMASFYYEASTRTRLCFEMAMQMMGGQIASSTENASAFSSVTKGETLEDTIRVLNGFCYDIIVLRHPEEGAAKIATQFSSIPVINAGDGAGEHPTQTLLDIYTIFKELGAVDGISIAMCGDLVNGRTVHSLSLLLAKFSNIKIFLVSPTPLKMRGDIKEFLERKNVWFTETNDLRTVASMVNVIYQTRTQKERGSLRGNVLKAHDESSFCIVDEEVMSLFDKRGIIMHPLPRNEEIPPEIDNDPRAAYFRQASNGLPVRMALLKMILG